MIYNTPTKTNITGEQYGKKISVEIDHSDTSIDELFDAFETICLGLGYHPDSWKQWIIERADEYTDEDIDAALDEHNHLESLDE